MFNGDKWYGKKTQNVEMDVAIFNSVLRESPKELREPTMWISGGRVFQQVQNLSTETMMVKKKSKNTEAFIMKSKTLVLHLPLQPHCPKATILFLF